MAACTRHIDALRMHASACKDTQVTCAGGADGPGAKAAAVRAAAALSGPFAAVASGAGAHKQLREELAGSCAASGFLAAACGALMEAAVAPLTADAGACEEAAEGLLALAVFLSGDASAASPPRSGGPADLDSASGDWEDEERAGAAAAGAADLGGCAPALAPLTILGAPAAAFAAAGADYGDSPLASEGLTPPAARGDATTAAVWAGVRPAPEAQPGPPA
ncbi:hypothetical protein MNEG_16720 [Monoraphidium neglectum]|uniref:Uncharacterized protein n=1 Tax=Monoraphidium neglectum TaxID=145388 RepID=A0A0D2LGQ3_9CHLO|nr:hypothetical protein MNEG_16720 [Monoraphidium neglectum]KIY91244.1 hypothetical protein MNEG_16720 [Monoraphidium neglectum]|eukprot:XP_013890264.1 hypothetical protein MNEG_16720 [Monoraphidium neglectum]